MLVVELSKGKETGQNQKARCRRFNGSLKLAFRELQISKTWAGLVSHNNIIASLAFVSLNPAPSHLPSNVKLRTWKSQTA